MSWLPKSSVVVPVDFSDESLAAVAVARQLVEEAAQLHVIHVLPVLNVAEPGVIWESVDDAGRCRHAEEALGERLGDADLAGADLVVVVGEPAHEIADFATSVDADVIVLPSHGRTGFKRLLIGSVAERVVRLAHCPVLVLKAPAAS